MGLKSCGSPKKLPIGRVLRGTLVRGPKCSHWGPGCSESLIASDGIELAMVSRIKMNAGATVRKSANVVGRRRLQRVIEDDDTSTADAPEEVAIRTPCFSGVKIIHGLFPGRQAGWEKVPVAYQQHVSE